MNRRPTLKPGHPQLRGLVLFVPWNTHPADQQGLFVRTGSLAWQDGLKLGGVSSPGWFNDPRFGFVPDFQNDTSNRAITSTATGFLPVQLNPITVSAWIWPWAIEDNAAIFGRWVTSQAGWILRTRLSTSRPGLRFEVQHSTTSVNATIDQTGAFAVNQWTHLAATWDGTLTTSSAVTLYVNGVVNTTNRANQTGVGTQKDDTTRGLQIGASNLVEPTTGKFKGRMGPVKVWNRVLSAAEIAEDFIAPELIVPRSDRRRRYFNLIGAAGAPTNVEADRSTTWEVAERVEATRSTSWDLGYLGTTVSEDRNASWALGEFVVTAWPPGPVNKPQVGQYEVRVITPRLIELVLVHQNSSVNTRPSRWNFVAGDWITLNAMPATSTFVVRQVPP